MYSRFTISSFTGGLTDNVKNSSPDKAAKIDNFDLLDDGSIRTRFGYNIFSDNVYMFPTSRKVNYFFTINETEFAISEIHLYKYDENSIDEILGDTGNFAIDSGSYVFEPNDSIANYIHYDGTFWKDHYFITHDLNGKPVKVFYNGTDWQVLTAGLPKYTQDPTFNPASTTGGTYSYIYYLLFMRTYYVDDVLFIDYSSVNRVLYESNTPIDATNTITISDFQTISNGTTYNYGLDQIKVAVYRSIAGGVNGYYVGSIDVNSGGVIIDNIPDSDLVYHEPLYINGGILDNDPPPIAKYIENVADVMYYASTDEQPYTIWHSKISDPDSVPESFYIELNDYIMGLSSVNNIPIVFTRNSVYKLEGQVDDTGVGIISPKLIDSTTGCISYQSIVKSPHGVYFASQTGFMFTDGYRVLKISENFNILYNKITSNLARAIDIVGRYDKVNRKVYWAAQMKDNSLTNDGMFIFYEKYGISQDGVFFTYSGFNPAMIHITNDNKLVFSDSQGYFYRFDKRFRSDIKPDKLIDKELWAKKTIIYDYISTELDFGDRDNRKWASKLAVRAKNISDISLQPLVATDGMSKFYETGKIRVITNLTWGEEFREWETDEIENIWENTRDYHHIRYIPKGHLRSYTKQIRLTNAFVEIEKSDNLCEAEIYLKSLYSIIGWREPTRLFTYPVKDVAYSNDIVAYLTKNGVLYTRDGDSYIEQTFEAGNVARLFGNDGMFFIVVNNTSGGYRMYITSDFSTYAHATDFLLEPVRVMFKAGDFLVVFPTGDTLHFSGSTWIAGNAGISANDAWFGSNLYAISGDNGQISVSNDGINWSIKQGIIDGSNITDNFYSCYVAFNKYIFGSSNGKIYYTGNFIDWYEAETDLEGNITHFARNDILVVATDKGEYAYTLNLNDYRGGKFSEDIGDNATSGLYYYRGKFYATFNYKGYHIESINETIKEVKLVSTDYWWNKDMVDYYISFDYNNYESNYWIHKYIDPQTIEVIDREDILPYSNWGGGEFKWIIRGYPKDEVVNIISYSLYYTPFGETFDPMSANSNTENAKS